MAARLNVAGEMLNEMINKSTTSRLFFGDKSLVPLVDLHDEVTSARLGVDLLEELGEESATAFLQNLGDMIRCI